MNRVAAGLGLEDEFATVSDVKEQRDELRSELQESVKLEAARLAAKDEELSTAKSNAEAIATGTTERAAAEQAVDAAQEDRDEAKKAHDNAVEALQGTTKPTLSALKVLKGAVSGQFADFTFFAMRAACWQKVILVVVAKIFGTIGSLLGVSLLLLLRCNVAHSALSTHADCAHCPSPVRASSCTPPRPVF